jgi:hypothetical protein
MNGRCPGRENVGIRLRQVVGVLAFDTVVESRVAVEVIEVFQVEPVDDGLLELLDSADTGQVQL